MKCTNCGAEVADDAKFCGECGHKMERKRVCPVCGTKAGDTKFCLECGAPLTGETPQADTYDNSNEDEQVDNLLKDFDGLAAAKKAQDEKVAEHGKKIKVARSYVMREMYAEAKAIYDGFIEDDPEDIAAYMGYIRIATQNYTEYVGEEIDKSIRIAQRISGAEDLSQYDAGYAAYAKKRETEKVRFAEEAQKRKEEEQERQKREKIKAKTLKDCQIENGVLVKYKGNDSEIVIPDSVITIGREAFRDCQSLINVTIPEGVISIGDLAFCNCKSLIKVIISDSVTTIGDSAFYGCQSLINVTISNSATNIGNCAFYNCQSLTNVTIPDSVITIGVNAFSGCQLLTNVTIPDSVSAIRRCAFSGCQSLTDVTIPAGVTIIENNAFYGCGSLKHIYCRVAAKPYGWDATWKDNCAAEIVWGYKD